MSTVRYYAVAHTTSPFISIYKSINEGPWVKLSNPLSLPVNNATSAAFSRDGSYLAVGHATSPFVTIYSRSGDTFTKLTNPTSLPPNTVYSLDFTSDDQYLAVGHATSPFVSIFKYDSGTSTFQKLTVPAALPTNTVAGLQFSLDSNYLACAHSTSPFLTVYSRSGDTFTKLTNPVTLPANNATCVAFTPDSLQLVVGGAGAPAIRVYDLTGGVLTAIASPGSFPGQTIYSLDLSDDGVYLAIGYNFKPYMSIYARSGSFYSIVTAPFADNISSQIPGTYATGLRFTKDSNAVMVSHTTTPFTTIFDFSNNILSLNAGVDINPTNAAYAVAEYTYYTDILKATRLDSYIWYTSGREYQRTFATLSGENTKSHSTLSKRTYLTLVKSSANSFIIGNTLTNYKQYVINGSGADKLGNSVDVTFDGRTIVAGGAGLVNIYSFNGALTLIDSLRDGQLAANNGVADCVRISNDGLTIAFTSIANGKFFIIRYASGYSSYTKYIFSGYNFQTHERQNVSIDATGDTVIVGGNNDKVDVYKYASGTYSLYQTIKNSTTTILDRFGYCVDISDDAVTIAIGAPLWQSTGAIFVYKLISGTYLLFQILKAGPNNNNRLFGLHVSVSNTGRSIYTSGRTSHIDASAAFIYKIRDAGDSYQYFSTQGGGAGIGTNSGVDDYNLASTNGNGAYLGYFNSTASIGYLAIGSYPKFRASRALNVIVFGSETANNNAGIIDVRYRFVCAENQSVSSLLADTGTRKRTYTSSLLYNKHYPSSITQVTYPQRITGNSREAFGYGVTMKGSGDYVAIGAPAYNGDFGAVYIYKKNGNNYEYLDVLTGSAGECLGQFVKFTKNNDKLFVTGKNGLLRVYYKTGSEWNSANTSYYEYRTRPAQRIAINQDGTRFVIGSGADLATFGFRVTIYALKNNALDEIYSVTYNVNWYDAGPFTVAMNPEGNLTAFAFYWSNVYFVYERGDGRFIFSQPLGSGYPWGIFGANLYFSDKYLLVGTGGAVFNNAYTLYTYNIDATASPTVTGIVGLLSYSANRYVALSSLYISDDNRLLVGASNFGQLGTGINDNSGFIDVYRRRSSYDNIWLENRYPNLRPYDSYSLQAMYGTSISGSSDSSTIVVGAPFYSIDQSNILDSVGAVHILSFSSQYKDFNTDVYKTSDTTILNKSYADALLGPEFHVAHQSTSALLERATASNTNPTNKTDNRKFKDPAEVSPSVCVNQDWAFGSNLFNVLSGSVYTNTNPYNSPGGTWNNGNTVQLWTYLDGYYLLCGSAGYLYYSEDGSRYRLCNVDYSGGRVYSSLIKYKGYYYLFGSGIARSTDLINWTTLKYPIYSPDGNTIYIYEAAAGINEIVAVGQRSTVLRSENGLFWGASRIFGYDFNISGIEWTHFTGYIIGGANGTLVYTTDGSTFEYDTTSLSATTTVYRVRYGQGYIALATSTNIYYSYDGRNWIINSSVGAVTFLIYRSGFWVLGSIYYVSRFPDVRTSVGTYLGLLGNRYSSNVAQGPGNYTQTALSFTNTLIVPYYSHYTSTQIKRSQPESTTSALLYEVKRQNTSALLQKENYNVNTSSSSILNQGYVFYFDNFDGVSSQLLALQSINYIDYLSIYNDPSSYSYLASLANANVISSDLTPINGTWTQANGILSQSNSATGAEKKIYFNGDTRGGNAVEIRARIRVDSWTDSDFARAGVSLRVDPATGRGYNFLFHYYQNRLQFLDDNFAWGTSYTYDWSLNTWYYFRAYMEGYTMYAKVWPDTVAEPSTWTYSYDFSANKRDGGYAALNGGYQYSTASFDDLKIVYPVSNNLGLVSSTTETAFIKAIQKTQSADNLKLQQSLKTSTTNNILLLSSSLLNETNSHLKAQYQASATAAALLIALKQIASSTNSELVTLNTKAQSANALKKQTVYLGVKAGLYGTKYSGYFGGNVNFASILPVVFSAFYERIDSTTVPVNSGDLYSYEWIGYFTASTTETYTFYTASDDDSYLWIGANAVSGFTTANALVQNGGLHPVVERSGSIALTAGVSYPIRIQFSENYGGDAITVSFSTTTIAKTSIGTGYYYYTTPSDGAFKISALLKAINSKNNFSNALKYLTTEEYNTSNNLLTSTATETQLASSLLKATNTKSQDINTFLKASILVVNQTESQRKATTSKDSSAQSLKRATYTRTNSTQNLVKLTGIRSADTNTQLKASFLLLQSSNDLLLLRNELANTLRSLLRATNTRNQGINALLRASILVVNQTESQRKATTSKDSSAQLLKLATYTRTNLTQNLLKFTGIRIADTNTQLKASYLLLQSSNDLLLLRNELANTSRSLLRASFMVSNTTDTNIKATFLLIQNSNDLLLRSSIAFTETRSFLKASFYNSTTSEVLLKASFVISDITDAYKKFTPEKLYLSSLKTYRLLTSDTHNEFNRTQNASAGYFFLSDIQDLNAVASDNRIILKAWGWGSADVSPKTNIELYINNNKNQDKIYSIYSEQLTFDKVTNPITGSRALDLQKPLKADSIPGKLPTAKTRLTVLKSPNIEKFMDNI